MPTRPGKFEASSEIGEKLHEISLDGCDEELGDVQDFGWYGLLIDSGCEDAKFAIASEDSDGFVDFESFATEAKAREAWKKLVNKYDDFISEGE